jgi:hypothetical protein
LSMRAIIENELTGAIDLSEVFAVLDRSGRR